MPEIAYTPDGQAIRHARVVPPNTIITAGGNGVQAVRVVADTGAYTAEGYQIQALRLVDASGNPVGTMTPITTQPEDMYTPDGYPIRHVRITDSLLAYTPDGHAITPVRFYDAAGAVVPPSLRLDFTTGSLPAGMTFTRASQASGFGSTGVLTPYATDVPRFVYDPATSANLGLLIEGARTNSIRNNTMVGAAAGTPGTMPTNWGGGGALSGLVRSVVGTGVEDGIDYIDIRWNGTPIASGASVVEHDGRLTIACVPGQTWAGSAYIRLVAGSLTNVTTDFDVSEYDGASALVVSTIFPMTPTSAALRTQRGLPIRTTTAGVFINCGMRLVYTINLPVDITLRIGLPQLELGEGPTSPIKTSTAAVTRAADIALVTDARALTDACIVIKARTPAYQDSTNTVRAFSRDAGATTYENVVRRSTSSVDTLMVLANVVQAQTGNNIIANNTDFAVAARYSTDNFASSINGGAAVTDTSGTRPVPTAFRVGTSPTASQYWNSTIRSIETRATASDAELVTLSTLPAPTDAEAWIAAVVANGGSISAARKAIVEQFIAAEKAAGTWELTDDYWPLWGEDAAQSLTSLKQRRLCVAVAAPTFTVDRGYTLNGTTQHLMTGFIPATHAVAMAGTNLRLAVYEVSNSSAAGNAIGLNETSTRNMQLTPRNASNQFSSSMNSNVAILGTNITDSRGLSVQSRSGNSFITGYKNGVTLGDTVLPTNNVNLATVRDLYIGANNAGGTATLFRAVQIGFVAAGASLSAPQEAAQYANVQAWATAIGANV